MATLSLARRRATLRRLLALAAALATGFAVWSYVAWLRSQIPAGGPLAPLVVAAADLEPGTSIRPEMLQVVRHPSRYLPPGALSSAGAAVGRVAVVPVFRGEPLTARKIGRGGGPSSVVPAGLRAYTLTAAAPAGGFAPRPGDRVDVIVTFPREVLGEASALTVLRWKEVASVAPAGPARSLDPAAAEAAGSLAVTLLVTPAEAERLAVAEALGRMTVVLAPSREEAGPGPGPEPVTPRDLAR